MAVLETSVTMPSLMISGSEFRHDVSNDRWRGSPDVALDADGPADRLFVPFPSSQLSRPIFECFEEVVRCIPDRIAIDDGRTRLTFAQVLETAQAIARRIAALPQAGPVAALLPNSVLTAPAILGCLAAGRPFLPCDLRFPADHNAAVLADARVAALLTVRETGQQPGLEATTVIRIDDITPGEAVPVAPAVPALGPDDPAIILYTSGSTGTPKGIANSQRALLQRVAQHVNAGHLGPDDRFLPLSSACTIAGLREILTSLLCGGTLYVADARRLSLRELRGLIDRAGVTVVYAVPSLIRSILADKDESRSAGSLASLRLVRVGGDRVLWSDIALMRRGLPESCHVQVGFSSTETTGAQWFVPRDAIPIGIAVPLGRVLPGIAYRIEADNGAEAQGDEPGELVVRGPYVALGHWHQGACVRGEMEPDPADPSRRIFRTGDMVRLGSDGLLHSAGRKDRQVKVHGQRVEPAELEVALRGSDAVADAAVAARRLDGDAVLIAFVVPRPSVDPQTALVALRAELRAALPSALRPASIHVLDALPLLPSMKVDLRALIALDQEAVAQGALAADETLPVEAAVGHAWTSLFGARSFASGESWREAGGDSLQTLMFVSQLEKALAFDLSLDLFDETMRPSDVAATLARLVRQTASPASQAGRPALLFLPGLGGDEPLLAPLRRALNQSIHVLTARYPAWPDMLAPDWNFESLVSLAVTTADCRSELPLRLAGYSFGGLLAYAVACRLSAMGHKVGSLLLLDTDLDRIVSPPARRGMAVVCLSKIAIRMRLLPPNSRDPSAWDYIADALLRPAAAGALRHLRPELRSSTINRPLFSLDQALDRALRRTACQQWLRQAVEPTNAFDVVLLRSEQHAPDETRDLGWGKLTSRLRVIDVPGSHRTMLMPPNHKLLSDVLLQC